jgi:hypothetical protein
MIRRASHRAITAQRVDGEGRRRGEAAVSMFRTGDRVMLRLGTQTVEIPLADWLMIVRPTVTPAELWPGGAAEPEPVRQFGGRS